MQILRYSKIANTRSHGHKTSLVVLWCQTQQGNPVILAVDPVDAIDYAYSAHECSVKLGSGDLNAG